MKINANKNIARRQRRHGRIRSRVAGTTARPRLAVFRSNKGIYGQIIDDSTGTTLAAANDMKGKGTKTERAMAAGESIAKLAADKKISTVVFDRGGYLFTGRVKAFAEGARKGGLTF